jgi:dTDP-glucose 4,6-dehydratase
MQRVLITGSAGFIGSTFARRLLARDPAVSVVSLDALTYAGDRRNLADLPADRHTFVHGDICDEPLVTALFAAHRFDTVVHFAAESHVDRSIAGSADFVRTNVSGTRVLLDAARVGDARFHMVSTDEVYGDLPPGAPASGEGDPYLPSSPYSASKAAADHLVRAWSRTYGLRVTLSLGSNTYGAHQYPEKLIPVVVRRASAGAPIPIYDDGQQRRDWLHVDDHADGILAILDRGRLGESYNIGGDNPRVNLELAEQICRLLDAERPAGAPHARHLTFVDDRLGHDRRYALDCAKARDELGWRPRVAWEDGLAATVRGILAQVPQKVL